MKLTLVLAGEMTSGKGTIAKYIVGKHNSGSYRFSTMLRDVAHRMYLEENRENLQKLSIMFRENFGQAMLSLVISKDLENDPHEIVVLDGARRLSDISNLKKAGNFKLVYVEATPEKRFERITARNENTDDAKKTFEEFKRDHNIEVERTILELKNHADHVVDNNGSLDELYKQIDAIIQSLKSKLL